VEVLLALRGTLNVANLEGVFEDSTHVHLVLELCTGGELLARTAGARHYGERTAASFLRAALRTVAQCHAKRVIHRDVKPGNVCGCCSGSWRSRFLRCRFLCWCSPDGCPTRRLFAPLAELGVLPQLSAADSISIRPPFCRSSSPLLAVSVSVRG
jgi:serine/threonine protein kinase